VRRGSARSTQKIAGWFGVPQAGVCLPPTVHLIHCRLDRPHRRVWSSPSPACRRHADTALLSLRSADQLQSTLSACLDEVSDWMRSNCLQLNTAKTEILWYSTTRRQNHLPSAAVRVGENHVLPSTTVRDLGILIDSDVAMRSHVSRTVSRCFAVLLRQRRGIRRSVSDSVFHSLVAYGLSIGTKIGDLDW